VGFNRAKDIRINAGLFLLAVGAIFWLSFGLSSKEISGAEIGFDAGTLLISTGLSVIVILVIIGKWIEDKEKAKASFPASQVRTKLSALEQDWFELLTTCVDADGAEAEDLVITGLRELAELKIKKFSAFPGLERQLKPPTRVDSERCARRAEAVLIEWDDLQLRLAPFLPYEDVAELDAKIRQLRLLLTQVMAHIPDDGRRKPNLAIINVIAAQHLGTQVAKELCNKWIIED
jgi:hypothetical protein